VIAFTSIDPQAGVGYFTEALARDVGLDNKGNVICLDSRALLDLQREADDLDPTILSKLEHVRPDDDQLPPPQWRDGYTFRRVVIERLKLRYQYVFISCPALVESPDILKIASLADGVIIVVEANRTQKRQITVMEKTIQVARGRVLGHILNKRSYPIPTWVYEKLSRFGI
jgi:Mrp family chromosome partitioning ATPase